jgi:hypothetical protein
LIAALTTAMTMEAISRPIARSQVSNIPWPVATPKRWTTIWKCANVVVQEHWRARELVPGYFMLFASWWARGLTRTEWPEWTEVDGHGRRIFPCSRILEEPLLVEAPPTVRRKRVTSKK